MEQRKYWSCCGFFQSHMYLSSLTLYCLLHSISWLLLPMMVCGLRGLCLRKLIGVWLMLQSEFSLLTSAFSVLLCSFLGFSLVLYNLTLLINLMHIFSSRGIQWSAQAHIKYPGCINIQLSVWKLLMSTQLRWLYVTLCLSACVLCIFDYVK